jgi:hemolysin III
MILPAFKVVYDRVDFETFMLVIAGGAFYTLGTYFFLRDSRKYYHSIWHLFVLGGTVCHFFAVLFLL